MKTYPSIPRDFIEFDAYIFDKIDGSNLRFEWTKKRSWHKFGTRRRLFDETDIDFGAAIELFHEQYAADLDKIIKKKQWQKVIVFMEFAGENSLGGLHENEPKTLTLIDVNPYKKGILPPKEFVKLFGDLDFSATFLGRHKWNKRLIQDVRNGEIEGITFEGIVGKAFIKNRIVMRKAKTQDWIDAIIDRHNKETAQKIINS